MRTTIVLMILLAWPAHLSADWLISRDGARIETRGPWQVKGSIVLFTPPAGTLSSMRLSEVDLAASTAASNKVRVQPPLELRAADPAARRPVLVLDNRNVKRAAPVSKEDAGSSPPAGDERPGPESPAAPADPGPVEVVFWQERAQRDLTGIEISGTLRNFSSQIATDLGVQVKLFDTSGQLVAVAEAFIDTASLAARSTTGFRAMLNDVAGLESEPHFEVKSRVLEFRPPAADRDAP